AADASPEDRLPPEWNATVYARSWGDHRLRALSLDKRRRKDGGRGTNAVPLLAFPSSVVRRASSALQVMHQQHEPVVAEKAPPTGQEIRHAEHAAFLG